MITKHVRVMKRWPLFSLNKERWLQSGCPSIEMEVYRTVPKDEFLDCRHRNGRPGLIRFIEREQVTAEKVSESHSVCSIGRSPDGSWWGWSHRARCRFRVGDRLFREDFPSQTDNLPFIEWGDVVIQSEDQAREAACNFAAYVSY